MISIVRRVVSLLESRLRALNSIAMGGYKKDTCGYCLYWKAYNKNPWYGTCYHPGDNGRDTWGFKERCDDYRENTYISKTTKNIQL